MDLIIVPDTHGCLRQVEDLIDYLTLEGYINENRKLAFLGDYVDRGPKIRELLNLCIDLQRDGHIFICGNHEYALERALNASSWAKTWFDAYEEETLESFGLCRYDYQEGDEAIAASDIKNAMSAKEIDFVSNLPLYWENEKFILIHATVLEYVSWKQQKQELDDWKRSNSETPIQLRQRTLSLPKGIRKCVVSGHDPRRKILITPTRASLDLAVFQSGVLTAWIPDLNLTVTVNNSEIRVDPATPPK